MDWLTGTPDTGRRRITIRPITRDGGAQLASARSLYKLISQAHQAQFQREIGRLWK